MAEAQVSKIFSQEELLIKVDDLEKRLQTKDAEIQVYKMLMSQMEDEVAQAKKYKALHEKQTQDVDGLRAESEKTLTKAKSMIFEKTKIIKNQELQIEAFTQQIESLREVVRITKDLLEIRNMEVHQLETKIAAIEGKQKAERERYDLMHKKLEMMIRHNGDLKREYETQLCLFTALRERYNERELAKDVIGSLKNEKLPAINGLETLIKNDPVQQTLVEATKTNTSDPNVKTAEPSPANTSDQNVNTTEPLSANSPDQNVKTTESSTASNEGTNTPATVPNDAQVSEQKPVTNDPIQPTNVAETSTSNQVEAGKANTSEQNIETAVLSPVATDEISNEVSDPKVNIADTTSNPEQTSVQNEPPAVLNTSTTNTTETVPIVESPQNNPATNLATEPIVKTENPLPVVETSNSKPEDKPASIVSEQGAAILESIEAAVEKKE